MTVIDSCGTMISAIRRYGMIPLSKGLIPGWSIQEQTSPDFWFTTSDELGPWDWKIDAVREGDIVYGKFLHNKASFATASFYRHLMNYRRSLPHYRLPLGENISSAKLYDRLYTIMSPVALRIVRKYGNVAALQLRGLLEEELSVELRKTVGGSLEKYLLPKIRQQAVEFTLMYMEMGTWTLIGDFERVYKGPNLEYKGWQRSFISTPEEVLGDSGISEDTPSWAKRFLRETEDDVNCSPLESREYLIGHLSSITGEKDRSKLEKII